MARIARASAQPAAGLRRVEVALPEPVKAGHDRDNRTSQEVELQVRALSRVRRYLGRPYSSCKPIL